MERRVRKETLLRGKVNFSLFDDGWYNTYSDGMSRLEDDEEAVIAFTLDGAYLYNFIDVLKKYKKAEWCYYGSSINENDRYQVILVKRYGFVVSRGIHDEGYYDYYWDINIVNVSKWRRLDKLCKA